MSEENKQQKCIGCVVESKSEKCPFPKHCPYSCEFEETPGAFE